MSTETNTPELFSIFTRHAETIAKGLESLDQEKFQQAADLIVKKIISNKRIFTVGNGASAAIANHWACDYTKGCSSPVTDVPPEIKPRVISIAANVPLITAISNDISYNKVYSYQLARMADAGDLLIAISSSGNSPNIIDALKMARSMGVDTIALTGFNGGYCEQWSDINLHVDIYEYEASEDCHQAIMHMIAKYIREKLLPPIVSSNSA